MEGSVNTSGVKVGMVGRGVGEGKGVVAGMCVVRNDNVGSGRSVAVGMALCVSTRAVLTVAMAVSMISAWLIVGVDWKLLQDASIAARNMGINVLPTMFTFHLLLMFCKETPN